MEILQKDKNELKIKDSKKTKFLFPLTIGIDPMERLLVASFKNDPEYTMLEPQMFDDPVNGKGMRVLRYRKDNKVDVYWQKGIKADRSTIEIGAGIGDFKETEIEPAVFEFTDKGVFVDLAFTDTQGRRVELKVKENSPASNRMTFLAPVGNDIEKPKRLFLVNMFDFDFVVKKGTEIIAKIGDREQLTEGFPILRNFNKVTFIRYSAKPVIGIFNPDNAELSEFETGFPGSVTINGMKVNINADGAVSEISAGSGERNAEVSFFPAYPNLFDLKEGEDEKGRWIYRISGSVITSGTYNLCKNGDKINAEIDVTGNWPAVGLPLSFKIFVRLASFFRKWPSTYRWRGIISLNDTASLKGKWERKK